MTRTHAFASLVNTQATGVKETCKPANFMNLKKQLFYENCVMLELL